MRNKLSVQQGEEGDEEENEMDVSAKDKQWGKSKRGYYGADTEDYEVLIFMAESSVQNHHFSLQKLRAGAIPCAVWHMPSIACWHCCNC